MKTVTLSQGCECLVIYLVIFVNVTVRLKFANSFDSQRQKVCASDDYRASKEQKSLSNVSQSAECISYTVDQRRQTHLHQGPEQTMSFG